MKTLPLLALITFLVSQSVFAQSDGCADGWCWGADPGTAKEKYALFSDGIQLKDYANSVAPFVWLRENTPNLNVGLYIKGVTLFEELLKKEEKEGKDPQKILEYQDKVLSLYDERIKYFGEEEDVIERKGRKMYTYYKSRKDPEKWQKMYDVYNRAFELNGKDASRVNFTFLMLSIVNLKARKAFTEDEVLAKYEGLSEKIQENVTDKKGAEQEKWIDLQDKIDDLLSKAVKIDCNFVRERWSEIIMNDPEDIKTSKY